MYFLFLVSVVLFPVRSRCVFFSCHRIISHDRIYVENKTYKEGMITKFKARLVARGFTQIRNVDYTSSSPPYLSSVCMKLVLAVANKKGLPLYHFDVAQAYKE